MSAPAVPADFWKTLPLGPGVDLLTHDANGVAAFNKPPGVLSHPNRRGEEPRSLLVAPYALDGECFHWTAPDGAPRRLWLLNRLDSATSGVILAAASETLARDIRAMFRQKHVEKTYHALVFGVPATPREIWRDQLAVQKKGGQVRTGARGNIPSESRMTVLRQNRRATPPLALIELAPRTGRSHQLRVQCAQRHLPIVGDATYGDFRLNREFAKAIGDKRLFLHSCATAFDYDHAGRRHHFTAKAPTPAEFLARL